MPRLVIRHLSKSFPDAKGKSAPALRDFNLEIADGELLTVVGPSGGGKTTLLRLIAGLEKPDEGEIELDGKSIFHLAPENRDVAMVFQNLALYPHLTVGENLGLGLKLRGAPGSEITSRVNQSAAILGIADLLSRHPEELSGGQAQRVALGRALVRQPKLFLLDEPLSNLDAPTRLQLRREIVALQSRLRVPMLHVTHDQAEALSMGQRVVVVEAGRLQQVGPPLAIYDQPANRFVATFMGSAPMNLLRGRIVAEAGNPAFIETGSRGEALPGGWALRWPGRSGLKPGAGLVDFGLRPEALSLTGPDASSLGATVTGIEPLGFETHVHLQTAAHRLVARVGRRSAAVVGERVGVLADLAGGCWFDAMTGDREGACS